MNSHVKALTSNKLRYMNSHVKALTSNKLRYMNSHVKALTSNKLRYQSLKPLKYSAPKYSASEAIHNLKHFNYLNTFFLKPFCQHYPCSFSSE